MPFDDNNNTAMQFSDCLRIGRYSIICSSCMRTQLKRGLKQRLVQAEADQRALLGDATSSIAANNNTEEGAQKRRNICCPAILRL